MRLNSFSGENQFTADPPSVSQSCPVTISRNVVARKRPRLPPRRRAFFSFYASLREKYTVPLLPGYHCVQAVRCGATLVLLIRYAISRPRYRGGSRVLRTRQLAARDIFPDPFVPRLGSGSAFGALFHFSCRWLIRDRMCPLDACNAC